MDIEFHYYMTYLTAARAGFAPSDAEIIAYSSQYVDDNSQVLHIERGKPTAYHNYITQTLNILKPKHELMRIYPIFHFIPGDPLSPTAQRKDGRQHSLNTTQHRPVNHHGTRLGVLAGCVFEIEIVGLCEVHLNGR